MKNDLNILRSRIPSGGFGRTLTSTEIRDIRKAGFRCSSQASVIQNGADYVGVVYFPYGGGLSNSGITVGLKS